MEQDYCKWLRKAYNNVVVRVMFVIKVHCTIRASDRVRQKMGNSAAFSWEIMRQERSIMRQIMQFVFLGLRGGNPFFCCPTGN